MIDDRPFTTVSEQIDKLVSRGMGVGDRDRAERFLLSNNYYRVVNGYKDFFIDRGKSSENNETYRSGSTFDQLVDLYTFDRTLRSLTLDAILVVESRMKTVTVHAFCEAHREVEGYLDPSNFRSSRNFPEKRSYAKNLIRLLDTLLKARDNRTHKDYVEHYKKNHGGVPLWVVCGCLTFGNMSAFFDLMKDSDRSEASRLMGRAIGTDLSKGALKRAYKVIPSFRNTCAHGERLFCARLGRNKELRFSSLCDALSLVMTVEEYDELMVSKVNDALAILSPHPSLTERVVGQMGIPSGLHQTRDLWRHM